MSQTLSPGSFHTFSINWRPKDNPYLKPGENLADASATVNGSTVTCEIFDDETRWSVAVPSDAVPGSKLVAVVSVETDSDPSRRESRTVKHYVGVETAKPL